MELVRASAVHADSFYITDCNQLQADVIAAVLPVRSCDEMLRDGIEIFATA